jgi:hypothetical protein
MAVILVVIELSKCTYVPVGTTEWYFAGRFVPATSEKVLILMV